MLEKDSLKYILLCKKKLKLYDNYGKGRLNQETFEKELKDIDSELDDFTASLKQNNKGD